MKLIKGELDQDISADDVRKRCRLAQMCLEDFWGHVQWVQTDERFRLLDYETFASCFVAEIANDDLKLPRDVRRELVTALRMDGMSQRAIADAVGVDVSTVNADLKSTVGNPTVAPEVIQGKDGKTRPARDKRHEQPAASEHHDQGSREEPEETPTQSSSEQDPNVPTATYSPPLPSKTKKKPPGIHGNPDSPTIIEFRAMGIKLINNARRDEIYAVIEVLQQLEDKAERKVK